MKTIEEVLNAFDVAALNAGLARNTRSTYASTVAEFATMMRRGEIRGVQDYLIRTIQEQLGHSNLETTEIYLHTAGKKSVESPLDSEAARNITPFSRTA